MDRREAIAGIFGAPLAVAGVTAVKLSAEVTLQPKAVSSQMKVFDRGQGTKFTLTLYQKPWPVVGDRITFEYEGMHLVGRVTGFCTETVNHSGRVFYHVEGDVESFDAKAATEK